MSDYAVIGELLLVLMLVTAIIELRRGAERWMILWAVACAAIMLGLLLIGVSQ